MDDIPIEFDSEQSLVLITSCLTRFPGSLYKITNQAWIQTDEWARGKAQGLTLVFCLLPFLNVPIWLLRIFAELLLLFNMSL